MLLFIIYYIFNFILNILKGKKMFKKTNNIDYIILGL